MKYTYKQLKEKFANNDYDDLLEDLYLEWQMCGMYETIEDMVKDPRQDLARWMCEDFPDRYDI